MIKTLSKHGNSMALVIDKPILDLLDIRVDQELKLSTDGRRLIVTPVERIPTVGIAQYKRPVISGGNGGSECP